MIPVGGHRGYSQAGGAILLPFVLAAVLLAGACTTEPDNAAPTAAFTVSPSLGTPDSVFVFDARSSDDPEEEDRFLQVRWDWDGDGVWDTIWGSVKVRSHSFSTIGIYHVVLEVMDSWGAKDTATDSLVVGYFPIPLFTVTPDRHLVDSLFTFDASATWHPLQDDLSLLIRWDWEGDGNWDTDWTLDRHFTRTYSVADTYEVCLQARDEEGDTARTGETIIVLPAGSAPTAAFAVDPASGAYTESFSFDASSSSDTHDDLAALTFHWDWTNDGTWDRETQNPITSHTFDVAGTWTVVLEVEDSDGLRGRATHEVEVTNDAPVAAFSIDPSGGNAVTPFTFDASGSSDTESALQDLRFRWDFDGDGSFDTDYLADPVTTYTYYIAGSFEVELEVADEGGTTATTSQVLEVSEHYLSRRTWMVALGAVNFDCMAPAVSDDGRLFLTSLTGIYCHSAGTGDQIWDETGYASSASAALGESGELYFTGSDSRFYALSQADGALLWDYDPALPGVSGSSDIYRYCAPAVGEDGTIYLTCTGVDGGYVDALDPVTHDRKWRYHWPQRIDRSPAVGTDGTIYFTARHSFLHALSPTGDSLWTVQGSGLYPNPPAVGLNGDVIFCDGDGNLHCYTSDGISRWDIDGFERLYRTEPAIGPDGTLYCATLTRLRAVSADGAILWTREMELAKTSPLLTDDGVLIYCGAREVVALDGSTGELKGLFERDLSSERASPALADDGTLYLFANGGLNAFETTSTGLSAGCWSKLRGDRRNRGRR